MSAQADSDRETALDLLMEEFIGRVRKGESPAISDYAAQHAELAAEIEELFPAALMLEKSKRQRPTSVGSAKSPPPGPLPGLPERLGDFRIVREIGRGGMGVVYEALQESLRRRVALKVLPPSLTTPRVEERFRREAQAAATLHHGSIVQVFGVGAQDGLLYYVMQFVDGRSLDQAMKDEGALLPRRAARIALQVARGLEHAHARGILHRDVKPANILLSHGDTALITDFGLAKVLDDEHGLTDSGDIVGTLSYLPPERLEGQAEARGDVYSLGLTLWEMLAGRAVFASRDKAALLHSLRNVGAPPLRTVRPELPRDLETIVLKATGREPRDRYAGAAQLADDLERWLDDRPIEARRANPAERAWRWCRRNRALAALGTLTAASLVLAAVLGWTSYLQAQRSFLEAKDALGRETKLRAESELATARAESGERRSLKAVEGIFDALAGADGPRGQGDSEDEARLLQTVLDFYDEVAAQSVADPELRLEAARAHLRVGVLRTRLGEMPAAMAALDRAVAGLESLPAAPRTEVANALLEAASIAVDSSGDLAQAERRALRAEALLADPQAGDSPEVAVMRQLAACRVALVMAHQGRADEARARVAEVKGSVQGMIERALAAAIGQERPERGPPPIGPPLAGPPPEGRPDGPPGPPPERGGQWARSGMIGLTLLWELARVHIAIAAHDVALGRHAEALAELEPVIADLAKLRGLGRNRRTARIYELAATCYHALGREEEALAMDRLVEELRRGRSPGYGRGGRRGDRGGGERPPR